LYTNQCFMDEELIYAGLAIKPVLGDFPVVKIELNAVENSVSSKLIP